jgi:hypothetical protein
MIEKLMPELFFLLCLNCRFIGLISSLITILRFFTNHIMQMTPLFNTINSYNVIWKRLLALFVGAFFLPRTTKQAYGITLTSFLKSSDHVKVFALFDI